jgi:5'-deoxynucleotidase YfbR-like HD superfamily hydrolase
MENLFTPNSIRTHSGNYVNVFDINPDLITIEDIAHGLSMVCRFGGHTKEFYSVAQHSWWVACNCSDKNMLAGLLHDASEYILMDIPKPIKEHLHDYIGIESNLMTVISEKFGFEFPLNAEVKKIDREALHFEWEHKVLTNQIKSFSQLESKKVFLDCFYVASKLQH